jgi:hypothetical protein
VTARRFPGLQQSAFHPQLYGSNRDPQQDRRLAGRAERLFNGDGWHGWRFPLFLLADANNNQFLVNINRYC